MEFEDIEFRRDRQLCAGLAYKRASFCEQSRGVPGNVGFSGNLGDRQFTAYYESFGSLFYTQFLDFFRKIGDFFRNIEYWGRTGGLASSKLACRTQKL